jgi:hypothetical protein
MDFKLFVDAALTGTSFAILIAAVGVIWKWFTHAAGTD